MGGNALKSIETRRMLASEYQVQVPLVLSTIAQVAGADRPMCVVDAYRQKPDFGDMDVLVAGEGLPSDFRQKLAKAFASREFVPNGDVTSFDRDGFQIDVIQVPARSFDFARSYFAWNDLGNLVGRIAHKMGAKYAFLGMYVPLRDGDHMFAEVDVTHDVDAALTFLGYDAKRFRAGFDSLEDIFRFTASTPYFDPAIFLLENRNATSRRRDSKRKTYNAFLSWLDDPQGLARYRAEQGLSMSGWYQWPESKSVWLKPMREAFPEFGDRLDVALSRKARYDMAKGLFNGDRVAKLTGLSGKELGEVMRSMRQAHRTQDELIEWALRVGQEGVDEAARQCQAKLSQMGPRP